MPKFPQVNVKLVGEDGNAFSILGRTSKAMRNAGCSQADVDAFLSEAKSGDYDHLLQTVMDTVSTDEPEEDEEVYEEEDDEDYDDDDYEEFYEEDEEVAIDDEDDEDW